MDWMTGWDWMGLDGSFFKIIVPRLHVPAVFFAKKTLPEKMYFLKKNKNHFYKKIVFALKTIPGDPQ